MLSCRPKRVIQGSFAAMAVCAAGWSACAQTPASHLPPTAPTTRGTTAVFAPAPIPAATAAKIPGHHAAVTYANGLLDIHADNSSLNVILRDIAQQTGMRITGGVADQRVFGNYGPADAGAVLATLLDGTGVNVLLKEHADHTPAELILTPRTGGITPPGPQSSQFDAEARAEALSPGAGQPRMGVTPGAGVPNPAGPKVPVGAPGYPPAGTPGGMGNANAAGGGSTTPVLDPRKAPVPDPNGSPITSPPAAPQPWNNPNGSPANTSPTVSTLPTTNSVPIDAVPTPPVAPPASGIVDAPNPPPAGTTTNPAGVSASSTTVGPDGTVTSTTVTSPNGVKTPDEIYQQLLKLQQQQQQQQQNGSGAKTPPAGTQGPPGGSNP